MEMKKYGLVISPEQTNPLLGLITPPNLNYENHYKINKKKYFLSKG